MPYDSPFSALLASMAPVTSMLVSDEATDATSGTSAKGQIEIDPSGYPQGSTFEFLSTFSVSSGALTGTVSLYNVTDAELVVGTQLNTSSTTPVNQGSGPLTVGVAAGNLKPTARIYEVRFLVSGSLPTDIISLGSASLRIT